MVQRSEALCDGRYIGIETIFTIIGGKQINIPEKLGEIRALSRKNKLFCPCGCGANLVLVAGDKNLREQHFRLKDSKGAHNCRALTEGRGSIMSKIVLKCWLDDRLQAEDLESRVPVCEISDTDRRYEFTFLSRQKKVGVWYTHERINLEEMKFEKLDNNTAGIKVVYIVDSKNAGFNGQYPELMMRMQRVQGYCLKLHAEDISYENAEISAVFYDKDEDGLWQEYEIVFCPLVEIGFDSEGELTFEGERIFKLVYDAALERKAENERIRAERVERARLRAEGDRKKQLEAERLKQEKAAEKALEEQRKQQEFEEQLMAFRELLEEGQLPQDEPLYDPMGNRWFQCAFCGTMRTRASFPVVDGAPGRVNTGVCVDCVKNGKRL